MQTSIFPSPQHTPPPHTTSRPRLRINPAKKDIDAFVFEDFTIEGYDPHETIKMKMAV